MKMKSDDASQLQIAESTQDQHRLVSRTNNRIPGTLGFLDLLSCLLYKIQPSIICQLHAAWSRRVHLVYGLHDPISSKFGSFVVEKPAKTLIPSQIVTLNLLCGCSDQSTRDIDVVTYRIESGDTLLTICLQFMADVNETAELNGLTNPNLILAGDVMFIPGPAAGLQKLTLPEDKDPIVRKRSKFQTSVVVVGSTFAAFTIIILVTVALVFGNIIKGMEISQSIVC